MNNNAKTLYAYEQNARGYVNKTPHEVAGAAKQWIDLTLSLLQPTARILELGSGFGRDADYIESKGFTVQRTDAAQSFVKIMQSNGHQAKLLNAITDDYGEPYDLIFADAVLLHFNPEETQTVLQHTHHALAHDGLFSFRLKKGSDSEWDDILQHPRFTQYWEPDKLKRLLAKNGFNIVSFEEGRSIFNKFIWLQVIVRKM